MALSGGNARDNLAWWILDYSGTEDYISLTHRGLGVLMPGMLLLALLRGFRPRKLLLLAALWVLVSMVYCNLGGEGNPKQIARYALPGLVPLCAVAGLGLEDYLSRGNRIWHVVLALVVIYPSTAYALIPALDSVFTTGSLMPTEDEFFQAEYPDIMDLRDQFPGEDYSVSIAWTGMETKPYLEVPPYVLRERRAEWPDMWDGKLYGLSPGEADYILIPPVARLPDLELDLVYESEAFVLYRVKGG
jgi:hypothetical protein